jgi:hypothetical protein
MEPINTTLLMQTNFQVAFEEFQKEANEINEAHGFNETDALIEELVVFLQQQNPSVVERFKPLLGAFLQGRTGLKIALVMSELGEAIDGIRKGNGPDSHIPEFSCAEAEYADAIIRLMNLATSDKCRLAEALVAKQNYNRNRPYRHGNKKF